MLENADKNSNEDQTIKVEPEICCNDGEEIDSECKDSEPEIDLQSLVLELTKKLEESDYQVRLARADLENFRRRNRKEKEEAIKYAPVPLLTSLLPVIDNLGRALHDENPNVETLREGVKMVYRQFLDILSHIGLKEIKATGEAFDPQYHHVLLEEQSSEHDSGIILEELQVGYTYMDRTVRPTQVKISS